MLKSLGCESYSFSGSFIKDKKAQLSTQQVKFPAVLYMSFDMRKAVSLIETNASRKPRMTSTTMMITPQY